MKLDRKFEVDMFVYLEKYFALGVRSSISPTTSRLYGIGKGNTVSNGAVICLSGNLEIQDILQVIKNICAKFDGNLSTAS